MGLFPIIVLAYMLLAHSEEKWVIEQFGDEYRTYQYMVPMFFPLAGQWRPLIKRSSIAAGQNKQPPD